MTIEAAINEVLGRVRQAFYARRPREWQRDRKALLKAVCRYGYECEKRGWRLTTEFITVDLVALLRQIKNQGADIGYLPIYLEGAVDRRVRMRAEEISAESKRLDRQIHRSVSGLKAAPDEAAAAQAAVNVAAMAGIYKAALGGRRRKASAAAPRQPSLL